MRCNGFGDGSGISCSGSDATHARLLRLLRIGANCGSAREPLLDLDSMSRGGACGQYWHTSADVFIAV